MLGARPGGLMAAVGMFVCLFASSVSASIVARVDLSNQRISVIVNGSHYASWPISSGRGRYATPVGSFRPQSLKRMHYSSKYYNSPMPYSVFFHRGYAIHGTNYLRQLGRPASHGCIRLHPSNAAALFNLIREYGMRNTRITITQ